MQVYNTKLVHKHEMSFLIAVYQHNLAARNKILIFQNKTAMLIHLRQSTRLRAIIKDSIKSRF